MTRECLEKIRESEKVIYQKRMELEALRYKATAANSVQYDKDKVKSTPDDYLTLAITDIIEIEKQIKEDDAEIEYNKGQAYALVKKMENPEHRTFIEWYYLNGLSMTETAARMNISERSVYYLRDDALASFAEIQ